MWIAARPLPVATCATVPEPPNGSRTVSPGAEPATMQRRASSSGNVAKWAPEYDCVVISQTVRELRPSGEQTLSGSPFGP